MLKIKYMILIITGVLFISACGNDDSEAESASNDSASDDSETVTLNIISGQDQNLIQYAGMDAFTDMVEKRSEGRIIVENMGGPEVIPSFNQGEAISNGSVDMSWLPAGYYGETVPEALAAGPTELEYSEELERGSMEFISKYHEEKLNSVLLGRGGYGKIAFFIGEGNEIRSMEDFNGLNLRGHASFVPLMESLGASVTSMPGEEIYSAMERGVIDGFGWGAQYGVLDLGVKDLLGYKVLPAFNHMDIMILINNEKWNSIPSDLQNIIREAAEESYFEQEKMVEDFMEEEDAELEEAGVEIVTLEDEEEYLKQASDSTWEWLGDRIENIEEFEMYFRE